MRKTIRCSRLNSLGTYTLAEAEGVAVGTKIVIHLRENALDFAEKTKVEEILKRYSNFIGFPIKLNGETVNTVQPVWAMVGTMLQS